MGDELEELRDVKDELIEERNVEALESRSINSGYKVLQILVVTLERHVGESREDSTFGRRRRSASSIEARCRRFELDDKGCEPSQCG
jgi:hypothetical protein